MGNRKDRSIEFIITIGRKAIYIIETIIEIKIAKRFSIPKNETKPHLKAYIENNKKINFNGPTTIFSPFLPR